jgi:predicted  nucleic acid-binding Zn-ribbon protein
MWCVSQEARVGSPACTQLACGGTQYADYTRMRDRARDADAEVARLRTYLGEILKEIEARAPALQREREERDAALERADATEQAAAAARAAESHAKQAVRVESRLFASVTLVPLLLTCPT